MAKCKAKQLEEGKGKEVEDGKSLESFQIHIHKIQVSLK